MSNINPLYIGIFLVVFYIVCCIIGGGIYYSITSNKEAAKKAEEEEAAKKAAAAVVAAAEAAAAAAEAAVAAAEAAAAVAAKKAEELKSLIYFYKFNTNDEQNGNIKNYATGFYDAILKNGAKITQLDYVVDKGSLLLDSSKSQYLQLPAFTPGSNGLTIAYWFKIIKNLNGWARLFDFGNGPGNNNWLQAPINGLAVYNDGGCPVLQPNVSPMVFENNIWYHSVWTLTPAPNRIATSTWNYYINGALIKTYTNGGYPQPINLTSNYIGKSNWGDHDGYFDGLLDEFRLYNKVLSASDVTALYKDKSIV